MTIPKISKQKLFEKLYIAEDKIKKEAKKYNVDVEFKNGQYGFDKSIGMSVAAGRGRRDEDPNVANKALEILGYTNDRQFYERVKNNEGCNNCLIIAFVNKAGRSYAVPYETGLSSRYFTESCVLYDRCENGEKTTAASIAHEMLHCFGAEDLYETF